jgi:protein-S-isoprenylcysteine O-methyltransferase Ste14
MSDEQRVPTAVLRRGIRSLGVFLIILGVAIFLPAGDIRWARGWLFLLVFLALTVPSVLYLWRTNPEIFVARSKVARAGTKRWDELMMALLFCSLTSIFIVAGFDAVRFRWSIGPIGLTVLGYVLLSICFFLSVWAESVNRFAEPSVRIQTDRDHKVIDTGPYAIIRHPMYSSALFLCAGVPLALGSFWALIPGALTTLVLIVRTILEDRTLQKELPGYKDYAHRVPHRLIPGVW